MSEPHVLDGKALMNKDFEAVTLPAPWMSGSCSGFIHKDPEVQAFRKAVPIYCGDFDLSVTCLKRKNAREVSFERFIASHLRQRMHLYGGAEPKDPQSGSTSAKRITRKNWRGYQRRSLRLPTSSPFHTVRQSKCSGISRTSAVCCGTGWRSPFSIRATPSQGQTASTPQR
ncbi:hypothetical protein GR925_36170 [Streptomyces sp. HUCO-GS316]|uniref:hypothetical protein n=1 Tax=Streptomyces sp. HUCO-GS316 TaxID=2692198 RepID=UPI00140105B4|nr:hypothetical protein [Streptomyces sp. HUCO-GS316]MXM68704.1 hypothetical protein [Streptomyces sp. HUCO-GS316]